MAGNWLRARQTKYAAYASVYILVVVTIAIVVNVLANRYNRSWDSTANKRYTLSDQTTKIVRDLKQDAHIRYYGKVDNFPNAHDLIDRYSNLSSRVQTEFIDIDRDPRTALAAGITKYDTTVIQIDDKKETARNLTEEGITGAFIRALKNTPRNICFVTGSGEHRVDDTERTGFSDFKDMLTKDNYTSKSISLIQEPDIPSDCTIVVLGGPTVDYQPNAIAAVQKYVESGGRALFLLDPPLKIGKPSVADNDALAAVLASWGATLSKDIVMDPRGQRAGAGPDLAIVNKYGFHPIVNGLDGTATGFLMARTIQTKNMDKTTVQQLFSSSEDTLATENMTSATFDPRDPKNKKGPLPLGAAGTFATGAPGKEGRFVVIGNSQWVTNFFLAFYGNGDLALNAMNWLSSDEDLISIRPKPPEDRQITMTEAQFWKMLVVAQGILPLLAVSAGIVVWWRRR